MPSLYNLKAGGYHTARLFEFLTPDECEPTEGPCTMYCQFGFSPIARHFRFRKPVETADS